MFSLIIFDTDKSNIYENANNCFPVYRFRLEDGSRLWPFLWLVRGGVVGIWG